MSDEVRYDLVDFEGSMQNSSNIESNIDELAKSISTFRSSLDPRVNEYYSDLNRLDHCKNDLSNDEIEKIVSLLEKNRVYEWVFDEFWNKAIYDRWMGFDGYNWYLSLIFEGDRVLNIGDGNDYPDTFVNLAEDVIEFANKDILKLKKIGDDDIKLYKKYAESHLKD